MVLLVTGVGWFGCLIDVLFRALLICLAGFRVLFVLVIYFLVISGGFVELVWTLRLWIALRLGC